MKNRQQFQPDSALFVSEDQPVRKFIYFFTPIHKAGRRTADHTGMFLPRSFVRLLPIAGLSLALAAAEHPQPQL